MQNQIEIQKIDLHIPSHNTLQKDLEEGLKQRYRDVSVEWVSCPDLTRAPFYLAAPGLCGNTALVEIGDSSYLTEPLLATKIYDIRKDILIPLDYYHNSFLFGNGIARKNLSGYYNFYELVMNAFYSPSLREEMKLLPNLQREMPLLPDFQREMPLMPDLQAEMPLRNKSSLVLRTPSKCLVESLAADSNLQCHGQGCFYLCNGFFGFDHFVLQVRVKNTRKSIVTSNSELTNVMQRILQENYGSSGIYVALGGVYTATDYSQTNTLSRLRYAWKHKLIPNFWETEMAHTSSSNCIINSPDTIISTFHSSRETILTSPLGPPIKLNNLQSTSSLFHHSSAKQNWMRTTRTDIEYFGYFCPVKTFYRIDKLRSTT